MPATGPGERVAEQMLKMGLEGADQVEILEGYCHLLVDLGIPLRRLHVAQSAFHPKFGGVGFDWNRTDGIKYLQYEITESPAEDWLKSPLYHLITSSDLEMRVRLKEMNETSRFPLLNELRDTGFTDYFAAGIFLSRVEQDVAIDPENTPEGVLISWASDGLDGFSEEDLTQIRLAMPYLGLALKSASNHKMARELLGVYLGTDAGNRVLSGEIQRGSLEKIEAAICYFDLIGFTSLSEQLGGEAIVHLLNVYFGIAVNIIESHGGNVLKFMGDGLLAMFDLGDDQADAEASLAAAKDMTRQFGDLNAGRAAQGLPAPGFTLALHNGEVFYGNIGADSRLDFTVIGPAVNQTARLSDMHRSLGQNIIVSSSLRNAAGSNRGDLVSMGRYMLRSVPEPQELFTLYPG